MTDDSESMISPLAAGLPSSGIRKMMRMAAGMHDVVHLEVGEPSFPTPRHIIEAASAAALAGATRYTPTAGTDGLRAAVARRMSARWRREVEPGQVIVGAGAVASLAAAVFAAVGPGDEILLPDPGWPNYLSMSLLAGATPRFYRLRKEDAFLPDLDELTTLVGPCTKAMIVNTPGNPTGAVFPRRIVEGLVALSREHGFTLISDEIYEEILFDVEMSSPGSFGPDVVYVSGMSKSYAMTGWRVGFAVAPLDVVQAMEKIQEPLVSCAPAISQAAAEAALSGPQEVVGEMARVYRRRRALVVERLAPLGLLPVVPDGSFYALVDLSATGLKGQELAERLLLQAGVATAPGSTFGPSAASLVRISFAADDEDLVVGCERIIRFHDAMRLERGTTAGSTRSRAETIITEERA